MRRHAAILSVLALVAAASAGCGEKEEPAAGAASSSSAAQSGGGKSLTGCVELWNGPHIGSTRMQYVAKRQTIYAKVAVKGDRCQVAFASGDGKVYGRYIEKDNATGPWTLEAERASVATAKKVVATANATGQADGTLTPGSPG